METVETPDIAPPHVPADPDQRHDPIVRGAAPEHHGAAMLGQVGSLLFADLVQAHFAWERERDGDDTGRTARLRAGFEAKLAEFCSVEGGILGVYWCTLKPSAVMLTEGLQPRRRRWLDERPLRLHRVTNWLMPRSAQKLVAVMRDSEDVALRAGEILRGTPRRMALRSAFELESELLAFLERTQGRPGEDEIEEFAADASSRIDKARAAYDSAADKSVRMVYVAGMFAGVALLVPVAVLAALGIQIFDALDLHSAAAQAFFACMAAGALGAVVSVLSRMGSPAKFGLDPAVGRRPNFFLGLFRPFVGSIFGLALYFLLQSSLLQASTNNKFATYIVVAFLGGFSERFVKVMLHDAESAVGGGSAQEGSKTTA
jgi:hypothetical protein